MKNNNKKAQLIIPLAGTLGAKLDEARERNRQSALFNKRRQEAKKSRSTDKDDTISKE